MVATGPPTAAFGPSDVADPVAAELLAELEAAHARLTNALAGLERIAAVEAPPDKKRFTRVRWTLSAASLTRRLLWAKILGYLLPLVGEKAATDLRRLQDDDIALLGVSTRHVAHWTTETALAEWPSYCEASRTMRGMMAKAIEAEQQRLYPILEAVRGGEPVQ